MVETTLLLAIIALAAANAAIDACVLREGQGVHPLGSLLQNVQIIALAAVILAKGHAA